MRVDHRISNLTLMHFACFTAVVETGTTLKASEVLHISQPQVSQKISQLENSIDVVLFRRENHRLVLTEAGQLFFSRCRQSLEDFNLSLEELRPYQNSEKPNTIRIGFTEGQEPGDILLWLRHFKIQFPEISTTSEIVRWVNAIEKILCGDIDMCILIDVAGLCENINIHYRVIRQLPLHCVVRRDSILAQKETLNFADLNGCTCYFSSYQRNTKIQEESQALFRQRGINIRWESKDADCFALRRYLDTEKSCVLTYSAAIEDTSLRAYALGGIAKPLVIAWKKAKNVHIEQYAIELASIIQHCHQ